ncbi:hypothetical protein XM57_25070 [Burkholderia cepacia]|nr:hypothetical protein XM57_25070 [Burkholderia cepacia]ETP63720.1 hypothetical protein BDSB_19095 [Burkholderia dolosa PC543]
MHERRETACERRRAAVCARPMQARADAVWSRADGPRATNGGNAMRGPLAAARRTPPAPKLTFHCRVPRAQRRPA